MLRVFRWRLIRLGSALLLLAACASAGRAAEMSRAPSEEELRFTRDFGDFLTGAMARLDIVPAISVAVARSDGPLYVEAFGQADIEQAVAAAPDTRFYIASSTKSFVGLAMALLDARGDIDLDWTLAELAPDIEFEPEIHAGEVTLRHLLSHTHGLSGSAIEFRLAYSGDHDPALLWSLLSRLTPNANAPLGTFDYSNIGYNVATLLVERELGRRWQEIVRTEIFKPLGMGETLTEGLDQARSAFPFAAPYFAAGPNGPERLYLEKADSTMQSAGGMYSTANDMARWLQAQLAAYRGEKGSPLPSGVLAAAHRPAAALDARFGPFERKGYGLGWYSGPYGGATLYHSFGGFSGFRAHVSFMPERDIGVALLTNDQVIGGDFIDAAAAWVYDWFRHGRDYATRQAEPRLEKLVARPTAIAADRAKRARRVWQLSQPFTAYAGRYCSKAFGALTIASDGAGLEIRIGRLRSTATLFTEPDTARVRLVPPGGQVLKFLLQDDRVVGAEVLDGKFERCD